VRLGDRSRLLLRGLHYRGWSGGGRTIDCAGGRDHLYDDSRARRTDDRRIGSSSSDMKRRDEVTVGILITVAVVVLVLGTLWLARGGLKSGYPLYTRFAWGQNLKQGQPVLLAGVTVGNVADVTLRRTGYLDVMLRINDEYKVPKGSKATVKAIGIFGDVAVALTPPNPPPAQDYAPGDTVPPGAAAADVDQIMSRVDSIGTSVSVLLRSM